MPERKHFSCTLMATGQSVPKLNQWSDPKLNISGQRLVILSWWWCQYCPQRMYTRPRPDATAEIRRKCLKGGDRVLNWWCNDMERRFREGFSDFVSMLKKTECFLFLFYDTFSILIRTEKKTKINKFSWLFQNKLDVIEKHTKVVFDSVLSP